MRMLASLESAKVARAQRVIQIGAILTVVGIALTLIAILPLVSDIELSSAWWFLSMITGVGLATVIAGLTMSARSRSRRSRRA
jgi:VIT1/CCC1 family predicted Fe2+/Mn2+ transporter